MGGWQDYSESLQVHIIPCSKSVFHGKTQKNDVLPCLFMLIFADFLTSIC